MKTQLVRSYIKSLFFVWPFVACWFLFTSCSFFFTGSRSISLDEDQSHSNFIVDEVKGQVLATRVNGLPEEIKISYTACFREVFQTENPLTDTLFKIHLFEFLDSKNNSASNKKQSEVKEDKPQKPCAESTSFVFSDPSKHSCLQMRTDANGCLKWAEFYPYKSIDQSVWFGYRRGFEGTGIYKGVTIVPMAVNPLLSIGSSSAALSVADLRYYSEYQRRHFVRLDKKQIPECSLCNKKGNAKSQDQSCRQCQYKQNSLSTVVNYFYKQVRRPRLWLNEVYVNVSQELFPLTDLDEDHRSVLQEFKICVNGTKSDCEDPPGRFFKVQLEMPLRIKVKDYRGAPQLLPLAYGKYSVKPYIFLQSERGKYWSLHRDVRFVSAELIQGSDKATLRADFYIHVPYERYGLPTFLGLKVKAEDNMQNMFLPFEGVFSFPNHLSSVIGSHDLKLDYKAIKFYKKNSKRAKQTTSDSVSLMDTYGLSMDPRQNRAREKGFRRAGWDIELRRFRFSDISINENQCPTPIGRSIRYVGEVCIIDPLTKQTIPNTKIVIKREDITFNKANQALAGPMTTIRSVNNDPQFDMGVFGIKGQRENLSGKAIAEPSYRSDATGCLRWVDDLYHTWYDRERYFIRKMVFSIPELGFEGEKMIAVNPWHWGFIFFQDITQLGPSSVRVSPQRAEKPRLVLHDFRSMFVNPVYTIDRWLSIDIFQNLLFLFRARIDRPGNVSIGFGGQRPSSMDIRRGYYWLRFILVKAHTEEKGSQGNLVVKKKDYINNDYSPSGNHNWNDHITGWELNRDGSQIGQMMNTNLEYITHFDTYTQIRDSTVNAYINFLFDLDQFIFIGSNNRVIVQLLPTDPKYYVYHEGTCKVDPDRSQFVPFKQHELIARPFMGTFISGERRNWNIFRILGENLHSKLSDSYLQKKLWRLNMEHTDRFVERGQQYSQEHKLFLQLQSKLIVKTQHWPEKSNLVVKNSLERLENLYQNMQGFLDLQSFVNKDDLIESIDQTNYFLTNALTGSNMNEPTASFFMEIKLQLQKLLPVLQQSGDKTDPMLQIVRVAQVTIKNLIQKHLLHSVDDETLKKSQKISNPDTSQWSFYSVDNSYRESDKPLAKEKQFYLEESVEDAQALSGINMDRFAKVEGLKVIAEDHEEMNRFITDINELNEKYNEQYKLWLGISDVTEFDQQVVDEIIQFRQQKVETQADEKFWQSSFVRNQQTVQNNFPLSEGDDYWSFFKKSQQMYLPSFSLSWLQTILKGGVHNGSIDTPEVMTFLHSMCFFWFDKFYDEYLEQSQLDTLYEKHLEFYDYYRSTLEYVREKGNVAQHRQLLQMMQEYSIDNSFRSLAVQKENPFFIYRPSAIPIPDRIDKFISNLFSLSNINSNFELPKDPPVSVVQSLYIKGRRNAFRESELTSHVARTRVLQLDNIYKRMNNIEGRHPLFKCLSNPLNFFHIENKIIVGDIGSGYGDITYKYGQTRQFNVQASHDWAYGVNWAMSRAFAGSLGSGVTVLGGIDDLISTMNGFAKPVKLVSAVFSFDGIRGSIDWNSSRSDAENSRRQESLRYAQAMYLTLNHSVYSIRLMDFRRCLVIRPQNLAFEGYDTTDQVWKEKWSDNFMHQILFIKSGLMLCSENIHLTENDPPEHILEDYFYLYQPMPGDQGQFQNLLNFRNRPYVMTVRGITELEKLEFLFHSFIEPDKKSGIEDYNPEKPMTNLFDHQPKIMDSLRKAVRKAHIWDKTGFYPGVYNVKYDDQHYYFRRQLEHIERGTVEEWGDWLNDMKPIDLIRFGEGKNVEGAVLDRKDRQ